MSVSHHSGMAHAALLLLCTCMALGHNLKSNHDTQVNDHYASLLHEVSTADASLDLDDSKMTDLTDSIMNVFDEDAGANVSKVGQVNASGVVHFENQSAVEENKTKVIEAAVVSLPMASFALEEPKPVKNITKPKFPGNATQKVAWEKKEKFLEKEVEALKARLSNASMTMESTKHTEQTASAAGTFSSQANDADGKRSVKFMAAKGPESMLANQTDKKVMMGSAFTNSTAKKLESIISLDTAVEHNAAAADEESSEHVVATMPTMNPTSPVGGWLSSFFSWLSGSSEAAPISPQMLAPHNVSAFVSVKQDSERTLQATREEHQHDVEVNDAWGQMEKEDSRREESVRSEDVSERRRAETAEMPHEPTKSELRGRHGAELSSFWGKLEKEDYNIEQTVHSDDLIKYAELTQAQDVRVSEASDQVDSSKLNMQHSPLKHNSDVRLAIHEPWWHREQADNAWERQVHDSPDLQMMQLRHHHQRT